MSKIKTWARLYERLGRQSLKQTKDARILLKNEDGTFSPLYLAYDKNGTMWWLEREDESYAKYGMVQTFPM